MLDLRDAPGAKTISPASPGSTLGVCLAALFALGIVNGAIGPLLPVLSGRVGAPVEALGAIFTALFLGALSMQVAGGWLNERVGLRAMVAAGSALLALAVVGIASSPTLPVLLACAFLAGAGQGALDASTNVLVPAVFGERSVSAVNLLHFAFGAGAVLGPVLTTASLSAWGSPVPALCAAAALGLAVAMATTRWALDPKVARTDARGAPSGAGIYARPVLWLLSLLLFLGVGVEMGVGGWTTVYADRTTALAPGAVALLASSFWLALMSGRLLGAALGMRLRSRRLALLSIAATCVGSAMLVLGTGSVGWTVAGTVVTGLGVGPIFPTVVVIGTELFPGAASRAVSVIIAVSSVGGMLLPPLQGVLLQQVHPAASVAMVAIACWLMLALLLVVERAARSRRQRATAAPTAT